MNTNTTTVNTPTPPSMADKIARATAAYSKRANHVGRPGLGGGGLGMGAMAMGGGLGMGALAMGGGHRISSEAAREMLKKNKGNLGALMTGYVQGLAGPVNR